MKSWAFIAMSIGISALLILYGSNGTMALANLLTIASIYWLIFGGVFSNWKYSCIHPYFERKLPSPGGKTIFGGKMIAVKLDEINLTLKNNGFKTISHFGYKDSFKNKENDWHDPCDGLIVIEQAINLMPSLDADTVMELQAIRDSLYLAKIDNI